MSASDRWGAYKIPHPGCGGKVEYWYFAPDCRGNPSSSGIQCTKCEKNFTAEEWKKIEGCRKKKRATAFTKTKPSK